MYMLERERKSQELGREAKRDDVDTVYFFF